ncbi:MAG TPA: SAM-dependent methyltransferase [Actinomycetota bacterium]|nr:SAM-dependent methyltransferase [Actinomycetota bacterium]
MTGATPLEEVLLERIRTQGAQPFAAFMSTALYHPKFGYYAGGEQRTGWRGHYLTSAELDPAFGALWTEAFERMWVACGRPNRFDLIEVGPGEGGFVAAVLETASGEFADALQVTLVERVARVQERQRQRLTGITNVGWVSSLDEVGPIDAGCIFANEVIDNLPVHLVEVRDGALREICVEEEDRRLLFTRRPPSNPELENFLQRAGVVLGEGHTYEVSLTAEALVSRAATMIGCGALVLTDYGAEAGSLAERTDGTLLCYSDTGVDTEPLERVGEKDLTVHANWTTLRKAAEAGALTVAGPITQRDVLRSLGSRAQDEELKSEHDRALAERRGSAAMKALSRRQALGALTDPQGLGGLGVLIATRGFEPGLVTEERGRG